LLILGERHIRSENVGMRTAVGAEAWRAETYS